MAGYRYEWDEAKRAANLAKHGADFGAISGFDWAIAYLVRDVRRAYGEERMVAYAPISGRLHAVTFTIRDDVRRIISLRKANRREQAIYRQRFKIR